MSQSLIEQNGKYYKEVDVVMLETNVSEIGLRNGYIIQRKGEPFCRNTGNANPQHLYFLSDEEIKLGDYLYYPQDGISKVNNLIYELPKECKKVIATTDDNIGKFIDGKNPLQGEFIGIGYPQPSHEFIQVYIEAYNSGKPITKVLVEVEILGMQTIETEFGRVSYIPIPEFDYTPKLKLKDNQIIIKKIEEKMYSESEVVDIKKQTIMKFVEDFYLNVKYQSIIEFEKYWIKQNLK